MAGSSVVYSFRVWLIEPGLPVSTERTQNHLRPWNSKTSCRNQSCCLLNDHDFVTKKKNFETPKAEYVLSLVDMPDCLFFSFKTYFDAFLNDNTSSKSLGEQCQNQMALRKPEPCSFAECEQDIIYSVVCVLSPQFCALHPLCRNLSAHL